jgi:hypothetical protein
MVSAEGAAPAPAHVAPVEKAYTVRDLPALPDPVDTTPLIGVTRLDRVTAKASGNAALAQARHYVQQGASLIGAIAATKGKVREAFVGQGVALLARQMGALVAGNAYAKPMAEVCLSAGIVFTGLDGSRKDWARLKGELETLTHGVNKAGNPTASAKHAERALALHSEITEHAEALRLERFIAQQKAKALS